MPVAGPLPFCACGNVTDGSKRHGIMLCTEKAPAAMPEDGFLFDHTAAVEMRSNTAARRTCRWCGGRMAFSPLGAYRCEGELWGHGQSCDEADPVPWGDLDDPFSA